MRKTLSIAIVGKGGAGKTVITALMAKVISENFDCKMLLIDADPTHPHLSKLVDLNPSRTLEQIRSNVIQDTINKERSSQEIAETIDFNVYDSIVESKRFSLLSMGQPETPGCFCPSNLLMKRVLKSISNDFDLILIDCEAGLEQIHRMVFDEIDLILVISDISLRSIETAVSIKKSAQKFIKFKKLYLVLNKVKGDISFILSKLDSYKLELIASIPEDNLIIEYEMLGKHMLDIDNESISLNSIRDLVKKVMIQ
jgi:CO dehydrogenase maturation factor